VHLMLRHLCSTPYANPTSACLVKRLTPQAFLKGSLQIFHDLRGICVASFSIRMINVSVERRGTWKTAVPRTMIGSLSRGKLEAFFRSGERISVPMA
jgi:hypothetical protein